MHALLLCAAVQISWQRCCVTAFTPIKFDYPHRCAITRHQCSAALFRAKCMPCCSVLLCKQAGSSFVPLHLHLSSLTTHTNIAITKHQCSAAIFRAKCMPCVSVLLCKHAGSSVSPMHLHLSNFAIHTNIAITKHQCSAAIFRAKCMPCCSVLLCKQAGSGVVSLHLHLSSLTTHTDVQSPTTSAVQQSSGQNACLVALCCYANMLAAVLAQCIYTYQILLSTQTLQSPNTSAVQQSSGQNALKFSPHWSQGLCVESDEAVVGELGSA